MRSGETPRERCDDLLRLMAERSSCRRYDPERAVPRELLETCIEAGRRAPSACNKQPWHFVVADDPDTVAALRQQAKLPGIPHPWWDAVPVFIAVCVRIDLLTHRIAPAFSGIPYYLIDVGIAGEHVVLAAEALGLGTCWIGWFKEKAVRAVLHIPRTVRVASLLTVGWPAESSTKPSASTRKKLEDVISWNQW